MTAPRFNVRKAAVLGAGVMGAQIAAHLTNAGIPTLLFELPAKEGDKNGLVNKAIANLAKLSPAPLGRKSIAEQIIPANYEQHLEQLAGCDLIIEAVAERMDIKRDLYAKIAPHVAPHAILASNTSGLSITSLSDALPESLRDQFCGVHFFNPPRYMYLVEIIPTARTRPEILDQLETLLTSGVGKGVIRAKDTPNFIANRVGVFSMLATMVHTQAFGLGFDEVDALTGTLVGRAKSATYRTADVVGLDTMGHVMKTMVDQLGDDPWHKHYEAPGFLKSLVAAGALGQKTGAGFYKKVGKDILVLDAKTGEYKKSEGEASADAEFALKQKGWGEKLKALRESNDPHAQFMWSCYRDVFHYIAYHLESIADNARDIDLAIRWGFGWNKGPFETWQEAGWQQVVGWIEEDIAAGKTLSSAPLPAWVKDGRDGVHTPAGSWAPSINGYRPRSALPVYARQHFPDALSVETFDKGTTVFETDSARAWHQGDGVLIYTFKSKANTIGSGVIDGLHKAIGIAEAEYDAMVIWQDKDNFSVGADLSEAVPAVMQGLRDEVEGGIAKFQATSMRIKYAAVPVVVAVRGMCLGGGCEFQMHSARTVAAHESYIGLVEAGVGLLPGGGGLKELALRSAQNAIDGDVFSQIKSIFTTPAMATVATSALEAKELKLLRPNDVIVMNSYELLFVAKNEAKAMAASGYRAPVPPRAIPVSGDVGIATIKAQLTNLFEGGMASAHDVEVATRIAAVLCGGYVERGSTVDEEWLLNLERKNFTDLVFMEKTQARIAHTLQTGKPLRN
jgi:3-hydroxyacyl-CoA dehydrogenase